MLVVRATQLTAMEALGLQEFADSVRAFLGRKHPDAVGREDIGRLISTSVSTCLAHGFDQEGTIIEFAEAMLTNSPGPLSGSDMQEAAETVLREFKARNLLAQLVALRAADSQSSTAGSDSAPSADETGT